MNRPTPRISAIAAIGKNTRAIGKNNKLLWHIPTDLKHFKKLTLGHPIIMGRKTFESILKTLGKPLPNRQNIVITTQSNYQAEGAYIVDSLEMGVTLAKKLDQKEIFIGGGGQLYKQALPLIDRLYLTIVESDEEGDTFFPPYQEIFTKELDKKNSYDKNLKFDWLILEKENG